MRISFVGAKVSPFGQFSKFFYQKSVSVRSVKAVKADNEKKK